MKAALPCLVRDTPWIEAGEEELLVQTTCFIFRKISYLLNWGKKDLKEHFKILNASQNFEKIICFVQVSVQDELIKKMCMDISDLEQQG